MDKTIEEKHYTCAELGKQWGLGASTVRLMFFNEPGVLRISRLGRRAKRDYVTLRIPASVAARVKARMSRTLAEVR